MTSPVIIIISINSGASHIESPKTNRNRIGRFRLHRDQLATPHGVLTFGAPLEATGVQLAGEATHLKGCQLRSSNRRDKIVENHMEKKHDEKS